MIKELLINFLYIFSNVYFILIFGRIILGFIPVGVPKLRIFVFNVTEPVLAPIRKIIPPLGGILDLSPIIFYLLLELLIEVISRLLQ